MDYKRASQPETSWLNTSISCDPDPESLGQPSLFLNQTTTPFKNDYLNRSVEAQHSNFCLQEPTQDGRDEKDSDSMAVPVWLFLQGGKFAGKVLPLLKKSAPIFGGW